MLSLKPRPSVQPFLVLRHAGAPTASRVSSFFTFVSLEMSLFPNIFVQLPFHLCMKNKYVRFPPPDGVFLPCDHGLDFFTSAYTRIRSIKKKQLGGTTSGTYPGKLLNVGYIVCEDGRGHSKRSNIDRPIQRVYHLLQTSTAYTQYCLLLDGAQKSTR